MLRETRVQQLKRKESELKERLEKKEEQLEAIIRATEAETIIWREPNHTGDNRFVPPTDRNTRFITVWNLKGGVGKTSLTANIGRCLAALDPSQRVLLIDLDFQGDLSRLGVATEERERKRRDGDTVVRLFSDEVNDDVMKSLIARGARDLGPDSFGVVLADHNLEQCDHNLQHRFFVDRTNEVRFHLQRVLHFSPKILEYDVVLFDCPTRPTTSVINALTCSDYYLIPCNYDLKAEEAAVRTVRWIQTLSSVTRPDLLGIMLNGAEYARVRDRTLESYQQDALARIKDDLKRQGLGEKLILEPIRKDKRIARATQEGRIPAEDPRVRPLFEGVVKAIRDRMGALPSSRG